MAKTRDGLTPKQKRFAKGYVKTGNATRSAKEAGYSDHTARSIGSENLSKPDIKAYIDSLASDAETVKAMRIEDIAAMVLNEAKQADHAGARVRAAELLMKWKGAFVERIEDITKRENDAIALISSLAKISPDAAAALRRDLGIAAPDVVPERDDGSASDNDAPLTH